MSSCSLRTRKAARVLMWWAIDRKDALMHNLNLHLLLIRVLITVIGRNTCYWWLCSISHHGSMRRGLVGSLSWEPRFWSFLTLLVLFFFNRVQFHDLWARLILWWVLLLVKMLLLHILTFTKRSQSDAWRFLHWYLVQMLSFWSCSTGSTSIQTHISCLR